MQRESPIPKNIRPQSVKACRRQAELPNTQRSINIQRHLPIACCQLPIESYALGSLFSTFE